MSIVTTIDIAAPPSQVRDKFLDFASLSKWHSSFFSSITPHGTLEPGQKLLVHFATGGQKMNPVIQQNTPTTFAWTGSLPFVFTGTHCFLFEESTVIPGGCRLTQSEEFSGALGWLMGGNVVARQVGFAEKTKRGFEILNADLKAACERVD
ncbi:hypothetical protein COCC4DRAFT_181063 [Bipolaris maydis ATCC 48331]|uniref:Uncharacterized protein n=2 Tax=Cochliobolus heterostrophus TaxID=5016 RepID=M2UBP2_COCH5|nr:uncharacterized protein COCC4DRAFT_181063 [Bipolaris maydis ATCC 48331]EMD85408.1 hypothetical protein COCHEDRAFT_1148753 [Bipolaris maydis C5]KAH7548813.1 hypothetical protein BM1_10838 [Bipolaris maydis]ENH99416.1 hypothetical protein COCC4DRAFT_181063 [Bipolaris maydis ATCC 48331]KAJ5024626.1 hypothetical protein J3E73DRAFT_397222 [Bipolaris maydis]KAJ5056829.1 hypothetical protein J3E74DRAFT_251002 [Bipolaris maydis]